MFRNGWLTLMVACAGILICAGALDAGAAPRVATARGVVEIQGEDVVVEVVVAVDADEKDPQGRAKGALQRLYPDVDSANYSFDGLVWDQFLDGDPLNDFVTVNYNADGLPSYLQDGAGEDVLLAGMGLWTNVSSSVFEFVYGGPTNREPSLVKESKGRQFFDGNNDVGWVNIKEPNVLGVTWYGTETDEFDIAIDNKDYVWYVGDPGNIGPNEIDLLAVLTHELGHALGLGHSDVEGAIMEPYYDGPRQSLHQDDMDGITALYPAEGADVPPDVDITSPADGTVVDIGASVTLAGTAADEDENLTPAIEWSSDLDGYLGTGGSVSVVLGPGTHVVTASATDAEGRTGTDTVTVTVRDPSAEPEAIVDSVTYATSGGRYQNRDLLVTVAVVDDTGGAVAGASVSILLTNDGGGAWTGSGATVEDGTVTFKLRNAPSGTYTTEVTGVTAAGLVWYGETPPNDFTK